MKLKNYYILCLGILAIFLTDCGKGTDRTDNRAETEKTVITTAVEPNAEGEEHKENEENKEDEEHEEHIGISPSEFCERASTYYDISEADAKTMYRKIEDSKILDKADIWLTGAVFNDYDGNGEMDMIVCLYEDKENGDRYTDGCLYLFMNDEEPYYLYDDFCCYYFGSIFGDFGADIDHDGNTEIVFCVQGMGNGGAGDCQKFVVKYKDNEIERMELPSDFSEERDYDSGLKVEIEHDTESGRYNIYCPYLDERIIMEADKKEEDVWGRGANSRGYYELAMTEHDGRYLLTGYEYLYSGYITNGLGSAVFVFDWDEKGKVFVSDWYVEDEEGKVYVPSERVQKSESDDGKIFSEEESGEEVKAYEEFLTGNREAVIADNIYTDTSYRGTFLTDAGAIGGQEDGFSLQELLAGILNETMEDRGQDNIADVQYALIDCGIDGKKQLALRAYGLGIYVSNDSSDLKMVFDYRDGTVCMVYAVDTWARSDTELYKNGYIYGFGSGGAASHYAWEGIIGADGVYRQSFECDIETGQGIYGMSSYWEVWKENSDKDFPAEFYEYTINDETIYAYYILDDVSDEEKKIVLDYIRSNEILMEVDFLTSDEAWELVEKNRDRLKITDEMDREENEIDWHTLMSEASALQR